jgi:hypothetical protein
MEPNRTPGPVKRTNLTLEQAREERCGANAIKLGTIGQVKKRGLLLRLIAASLPLPPIRSCRHPPSLRRSDADIWTFS